MNTFVNNTKTFMMMAMLTGLLVAVGGMIGKGFLIPFLIMAVLMNVGAWFFSDRIAIKAMRGKEVTAESGGAIYEMVERLSRNAELPMPKVYICPHEAPNAFATGRSPKHAAVAFTQGALNLLDKQELEGVTAHELAHIKNRDTLTSCVAATIAGVLAGLAQWGFFLGLGNNRNSNPLLVLGTVVLAAVGAALIKAAVSRSREFVADAEGARIAGTPNGLASALRKLDAYSRQIPLQQPNPAQNNLFIIEPLAGQRGRGFSVGQLFATHPPTERRLEALSRLS